MRGCGVGNRGQRPIAIVEGDMAALAQGREALEDLEALLLRFGCRPAVSAEDAERMGYALGLIRRGFGVVEKYLRVMRAEGWRVVELETVVHEAVVEEVLG